MRIFQRSLTICQMRFFLLTFCLLAIFVGSTPARANPGSNVFWGEYVDGEFVSLEFVNNVVGWDLFFYSGYRGTGRIVANVEAGHVWSGHDVFIRPSDPAVGLTVTGTGALDQFDYHATMVAHMMAGTGYLADVNDFTLVGIGMAPLAEIWSGAIATSYSTTNLGSFDITNASALSVYQTMFEGVGGRRPDVINSSWGGFDPAAVGPRAEALDGLAAQYSTTALVVSAGNAGADPVGSPASGFNQISVGSLGGTTFLDSSSFSSRGLLDFYNPVTEELHVGVRTGVHISAPGELLVLAAYLGDSGSIGAWQDAPLYNLPVDPSPTDQFFLNMDGTSFSAPMVAGGIALLREVAADPSSPFNLLGAPHATDTRVIRSVLMAGATETNSWDNGQTADGGVIRTTMAVDAAAGAGRLDLEKTAGIYLLAGTRDLDTPGGTIESSGWDFGTVGLGGSTDYQFTESFAAGTHLTVSLNWFAGRTYLGLQPEETDPISSNDYFADLNLQVWRMEGGDFFELIAESVTVYNSTEFLRLQLSEAASYGLRVTFHGLVFDTSPSPVLAESYGLAWTTASPIPEPGSLPMLLLAGMILLRACARSRRNADVITRHQG